MSGLILVGWLAFVYLAFFYVTKRSRRDKKIARAPRTHHLRTLSRVDSGEIEMIRGDTYILVTKDGSVITKTIPDGVIMCLCDECKPHNMIYKPPSVMEKIEHMNSLFEAMRVMEGKEDNELLCDCPHCKPDTVEIRDGVGRLLTREPLHPERQPDIEDLMPFAHLNDDDMKWLRENIKPSRDW